MALHVEGYRIDHPVMAKGLACLDDPGWRVDVGDATFIQATNSPGLGHDPDPARLRRRRALADDSEADRKGASHWLLDRQVRVPGDWSVKLPHVKPGGWAFEYANNSYPDIDDTAVALIALAPFRNDPKWQARGIEEAIQRGVDWLIAHAERERRLGRLRQGQHQAVPDQDPVLRFRRGARPALGGRHRPCRRGLRQSSACRATIPPWSGPSTISGREQEPDGSWFGRWGVNYIYGTGAVLPALAAHRRGHGRSPISAAPATG